MIRRTIFLFGCTLLLIATLLSLLRTLQTAQSSFGLAYISNVTTSTELYFLSPQALANPQWGTVIQLTATRGSTITPAWSQDGRWLVFASNIDRNLELYRVAVHLGQKLAPLERLTWTDTIAERFPAWSPDGQHIAYLGARRVTEATHIFVMESDRRDSTPIQLTLPNSDPSPPVWSPDGEWLVFTNSTVTHPPREVYRARPDGSVIEQLTSGTGDKFAPAWSPDGQWILFERLVENDVGLRYRNGQKSLQMMRADGSDVQTVINTQGEDSTPIWLLDGDGIVFESRLIEQACVDNCQMIVEIIHFDRRTQLTRLLHKDRITYATAFLNLSPDGQHLSFVTHDSRSHATEVFQVPTSTTQSQTHFASTATNPNARGDKWHPLWSPLIDMPWHGWRLLLGGLLLLSSGLAHRAWATGV